MESNEKTRPITPPEAAVEIAAISQQIMQAGAADVEPGLLREILDALSAGKIEPKEAIRRAREIQAKRQNYH
ncbi:MAG: hypothetical protein Q8P35_01215 [Candidatus Yanofskybacteria bacterium]|nr:hypothetical protein [Candidatus Yanofskybacteria bacterium]